MPVWVCSAFARCGTATIYFDLEVTASDIYGALIMAQNHCAAMFRDNTQVTITKIFQEESP